jgi:hypothetical protein
MRCPDSSLRYAEFILSKAEGFRMTQIRVSGYSDRLSDPLREERSNTCGDAQYEGASPIGLLFNVVRLIIQLFLHFDAISSRQHPDRASQAVS